MLIGINPITGKRETATFKQWRRNFYRGINVLIEKTVYETLDWTTCKICGRFWSPIFNSEIEHILHLKKEPHHLVWKFLNNMKWEKSE